MLIFQYIGFLPSQWQTFLPNKSYHLEGGKGDFEVWVDIFKGQLSELQTRLQFHRLAWSKDDKPHSQFIQFLGANLAWKKKQNGWQLSGDKN